MAIVLWHVTMSLDGFIAGPGDSVDWAFKYGGPDPAIDEVIRTTGALLVGRRSYDVGRREGQRPEAARPYGGAWSGPQFVLTHVPPEAAPDPAVTFLSTDIRDAVSIALGAAKGRNVVVIGADVARQCVEAGLIDEILVHVPPMLLGDGVRLFGRPGAAPVDLEPLSVERVGPIANLRYRVVK